MSSDPSANIDLAPLASAISKLAEDMAGKMIQETLPTLIKSEVELALKAMVPGMVERAIADEKVLIKETTQDLARQSLPDLLKPLVDELAKDIVEKVAREVVSTTAETEVVKEIERLKADA